MAKLIPIHCSLSEVKALNYMQGGQYVDPESGLREYSRLSPIFKDDAARQLFVKLAAMVHTHKRLPDDVTNFTKGLAKQDGIGQYYTEIPSDSEPEIKALERMGQGKDNKVVMMPLDVVKFLDSLRKTSKVTNINRRTGLEQFNFFEDILQSASAILGGAFGGKEDPNKALDEAEGRKSRESREAREKTETPRKAKPLSKEDILPLSAMGAGVFFKHQAMKDKQKQLKRMGEVRQSDLNAILSKTNFNEPMRHAKGDHVGRPIVGKGKGQEDLIKDDKVREGSWIWDATTVGHCGDGSTKAGQQEIKKLEEHVLKGGHSKRFQALATGGKAAAKPPIVPCALSDGERATPTAIVTAAGDGDNEKGAARFRAVTKYLRRHKISNGTELPPAAPDIIKLFKSEAIRRKVG